MRNLIRFLFSHYWKYKAHTAGILFCMIVAVAFNSIFSLSIKYSIDHIIVEKKYEKLVVLLLSLLCGFVVYFISQWLKDYWVSRVSVWVQNDIRLELFGHLQKLPVSYYDRVSKGSLVSRFTNDLGSVHSSFLSIVPAVYSILSILVYTGLTASLHWSLAALSLLGIALSFILPVFISRSAVRLNDELKTKQNVVLEYIQEHFTIYKTVRAYNLKRWEYNRLKQTTDALQPISVRTQLINRAAPLSVSLALLFFNITTVMVGAYLVMREYISVGMLIAFQSLFLTMSQQVKELIQHLPSLTSATASYMRLERLLNETLEDEIDMEEQTPQLNRFEKDITLQGVSFAYSPEHPVIDNIDLRVPATSYVAIIGMNGSGKSTVINLLMRFYEPTAGSVKIDGTDARQFSANSLRDLMGYVSQETQLMNLSIMENIKLGKTDATDQAVIDAARAAGIHDWISSLTHGYQTNCGEDGHALSGGQRQRIAIARALVRDPSIMLLDEATSALDPESETVINQTIRGLAGSKTVINVTHRLSTVTDADIIFLMEAGKLIQGGTHKELLAKCELYRILWNKQSGFMVSGDGRFARIDTERLKKIPLFSGLDDTFMEFVCDCLGTEYVQAGETVMERGGEGDKFYIVVRGQIEVLKQKTGTVEEIRVAVLEDGDHFGEISLMMSQPRNATIRTLTPCTFLSIQRNLFQSILDKAGPELRWRLEQSCRERMTY